ncbi:hypothetical protein LMIY3S_01883 [Labrys miyagiensis]
MSRTSDFSDAHSDFPRLRFYGAAQTVTGSCFGIETSRARVLVDCGLFQGSKTEKELNYRPFPFEPSAIDAVLLTHAHIDHSGLLPKLVKDGFAGSIFTTKATVDLCSVMLPDSGHIQEMEVQQLNSRNARRGLPAVNPIYDADQAIATMTRFRPVEHMSWIGIAEGVRARFWNAGHLLGSASIEMEIERKDEKPLSLLFSGDIGPGQKLLQTDPEAPTELDYVICESTYGDTDRPQASAQSSTPRPARRGQGGRQVRRRPAHPVLRGRAHAGASCRSRPPDECAQNPKGADFHRLAFGNPRQRRVRQACA